MSTPTTPEPGHFGGPASDLPEHPAWCARTTDDGPCEVAGWHASAWVAVPSEVDDAPLIEAQLFTGGPEVLIALRFTYDRDMTVQILPFGQATVLAAVLFDLAAKARGGAR